MEDSHFLNLSQVEKKHWYFAARRQTIADLIRRYITPHQKESPLKILDVGCGTGGTTDFLSRFGTVTGLEPAETAIGLLKTNYPHLNVIKGSIEDMNVLFDDEYFDLAILLGVLCHKNVDSPLNALKSINHKLKVGGWLIWHESAYPFLRHKNDELSHGVRRFWPSQMRSLLMQSGFRVCFKTHMGSFTLPFAFLLALSSRIKDSLGIKDDSAQAASLDRKIPPHYLNAILYGLIRAEIKCAFNFFPIPLGVSYLVMAEKIKSL